MERKSQIGYNIGAKIVTCIFLYAKCAPHRRFWYQQKKLSFFHNFGGHIFNSELDLEMGFQVQNLASLIRISEILNLQNKIYIFFREINTYSSTHSIGIARF